MPNPPNAGTPGGDTRPGVILFHATMREPDGSPKPRLFRPQPDANELLTLKTKGWVDHPGLIDAEPEPVPEPEIVPPPAPVAKVAAKPKIDIRTVPADEAVVMVGNVSDTGVLKAILERERTTEKPKGGRKSVLQAITDRIIELL